MSLIEVSIDEELCSDICSPETSLSFGGAVYDLVSGPPVTQLFPGTVTFRHDTGHNKQLGERSLWAFANCIRRLSKEAAYPRPPGTLPIPKVAYNVPRVGLKGTGVIIADMLTTRVVFRARIDIEASTINEVQKCLKNFLESYKVDDCIVKAIYPLYGEGYGVAVHKELAAANFAPVFICELPHESIKPESESKSFMRDLLPLIKYFVMEYLPPPALSAPGWITLDDLAFDHTALAHKEKPFVIAALKQVLQSLKVKNFVHGDLRPNNIMVKIYLRAEPRLSYNNDGSLMIKVIDYDWAGELGKARYPAIRNSGVHWPGDDGELIGDGHDAQMVQHWMENWPQVPQPLYSKEQPILGVDEVDED